ncbi:conserved hypothetical protein (plasmid) [Nitrobacter hamburgensis X14]|uniref:Probable inorganic carbon transporter subunit DabA 1 n=2 Tax=Nitrobacter hamburgensis TaxID=912 RepID=DABA1_NITHX|nr:RecName: Full=Probable inorganic carbon transporter subunit DabA 1 [Nitrobacter hamburgensis X14]ABE64920.1 conserved hypothetical protein [Nitrobacter hamburgensis X14]
MVMVDALNLGRRLRVRSTAYVAGEPVPFFWPMRTFIHHNPLYGLEHMPFEQAVRRGAELFHARMFLPRSDYQRWQREGKVRQDTLAEEIARRAQALPAVPGIDWPRWLQALMQSAHDRDVVVPGVRAPDVHAALHGQPPSAQAVDVAVLLPALEQRLHGLTLPEAVDALWGTRLADELDELVIKSYLDFFDEDQSSWRMPGRERGLFAAWSEIARRNARMFLRGLHVRRTLGRVQDPESAVVHVMEEMGIDPDAWSAYFTRELTRLHGWTGFVRWRSSAKHYYWAQRYPAEVVDLLAVRLVVGLALLQESARHRRTPVRREQLDALLHERGAECLLRNALHSGEVLPDWAQRIDDTLSRGGSKRCEALLQRYWPLWQARQGQDQAAALRELAAAADATAALEVLSPEDIAGLIQGLQEFARQEGMVWTLAMEAQAIDQLLAQVQVPQDLAAGKRPFAQAWFCIDVRAEPIRRHLERVGDYQTFGIAGFFGVPVGFLGYGKGSESHFCPAVVTPKNLVLELPAELDPEEDDLLSTLGHVLHDLKSSVLSPYVTVEAVGMLFGLDLFGKTLAPLGYSRWRNRIDADKPVTRLLVDKLTREQADSIIRTLQRAMIVKALHAELHIERERVDDDMIRELRETALRHREGPTRLQRTFGVSDKQEAEFIDKLREVYRVDADYASYQLVRLGRIGYSLDEQVNYVHTALTMIGLTKTFSRFVLIVGHSGQTENNPYESALDCGACGGASGLVNARVLAQMANKTAVRERLRGMGIDIPDDTWFLPALHNTTTDAIELSDLVLLPPRHLVYLDRLRNGLRAASRLAAAERMPKLLPQARAIEPAQAWRLAHRLAVDWAQVRPEWGLSKNVYGIIGRRSLSERADLQGRPFLMSYDWRCDPKGRLLENLLAAAVVVGQWINLEHFFSTVDNARLGSGSKAYHNVAGRFGVMTGSLSDLRTGLPAQTVMREGQPYHEPMRMIALIEAPLDFAGRALQSVVKVKSLVLGGWIRAIVIDPTQGYKPFVFNNGQWEERPPLVAPAEEEHAA